MYGFFFESSIKELVDADIDDFEDIISALHDIYGEDEIVFGGYDEDSDKFYCYAAVEITNDIFEDEEGAPFSMDLEQLKENDRKLYDFIDGNAALNEYAFCNTPRIFVVQ